LGLLPELVDSQLGQLGITKMIGHKIGSITDVGPKQSQDSPKWSGPKSGLLLMWPKVRTYHWNRVQN
jgi:hypothetical protein